MTLSVIVPVNNEYQFLDECLASIVAQDVECLEIILIDDGSEDGTSGICDTWSQEYDFIQVHHSPRSGLSTARNLGIDRAQGDYIAFVDGDDILHPDMYRTMLGAAISLDVDIVECGFFEIETFPKSSENEDRTFVIKTGRDILMNPKTRNIVVWNKIYRRFLWDDMRFPLGRIHEDEFVFFRLFFLANRILVIGESFYRYRRHSASITGRGFSLRNLDLIQARIEQILFFQKNGDPEILEQSKLRWFRTSLEIIIRCKRNGFHLHAMHLRCRTMLRLGWILGHSGLTPYRKMISLAQILSIGRRFTLFRFFQLLIRHLRRMLNKQSVWAGGSAYRIYSFLEPTHGNLGDHAIILGQQKFLSQALPEYEIISVTDRELETFMDSRRPLVRDEDLIVMAGGGNFGDDYPMEEEARRRIIRTFPKNEIISFPQSVHFDESQKSSAQYMETVNIYSGHETMHLFTRDYKSLDKLRTMFPQMDVDCFPDMALNLNPIESMNRDGVLLCLRSDKEGFLDVNQKLAIIDRLTSLEILYKLIDNQLNRQIQASERFDLVYKYLEEYSRSRLVVTDRLHGIVFSMLTGTPCLAVDNSTHKIRAFIEWAGSRSDVRYYDPKEFDRLIRDLDSYYDNAPDFHNADFTESFRSLSEKLVRIADEVKKSQVAMR